VTEFRSKGLGAGMKKIIMGIVFVIVIAGAGAPFFNGLVMENIVRDSLSNVNTMYADTASGVSVEIINYDDVQFWMRSSTKP
jgi:hypothetical protein